MEEEIVVQNDPKSPISEIFKNLRTNIQFMGSTGELKSILITSTLPGEGKSWISANLAVTFAQTGKVVCLIDADMRKGRQHSIFKIKKAPGLSNYLSGYYNDTQDKDRYLANYLQETDIKNLFVIGTGTIPPNPSELLLSEYMRKLIKCLNAICDIIIIDGPPSQLVTDSIVLSRVVDSTVIVVENKKTKKENLREIIKNIKNVGGNIAGVVLNKAEVSNKEYKYSYYYGSKQEKKDEEEKLKPFIRVDSLISNQMKKNEDIKKEIETYEKLDEEEEKRKEKARKIREVLIDQAIKEEEKEQIEIEKRHRREELKRELEEEEKRLREEELQKVKNQMDLRRELVREEAKKEQEHEINGKVDNILTDIDSFFDNKGNNLNE